jgi:hypothetical protein
MIVTIVNVVVVVGGGADDLWRCLHFWVVPEKDSAPPCTSAADRPTTIDFSMGVIVGRVLTGCIIRQSSD